MLPSHGRCRPENREVRVGDRRNLTRARDPVLRDSCDESGRNEPSGTIVLEEVNTCPQGSERETTVNNVTPAYAGFYCQRRNVL